MKKYLLVFLFSLSLYLLVGVPLRLLGFIVSTIIESVCYVFLTYFILKKMSSAKLQVWQITSLILLARIIIEIPLRVANFEGTLISLPNTSMVCLTIVLTSLFYVLRKKSVFLLFLFIWSYCVFIGHKQLLEYMAWRPSFESNVSELTINTSEGRMSFDSLDGEFILLDFWISSCGVCFKEFPDIQSLFDKNDAKVSIVSVFVPFLKGEQELDGKAILEKRGYTFPVWSVSSDDTLLKALNINKYPAVILLDKERNVVFRGSLEYAKKRLEDIINQ